MQPSFRDKWLVDDLASEIGMPEIEVTMIANSCLRQFVQLVNMQRDLTSSIFKFTMVATSGKFADGGNAAKPGLKFARITVNPANPSEPV